MSFEPFERRLARDGAPALVRRAFARAYARLAKGERGFVPERALESVGELPHARALTAHDARAGAALLARAQVAHIKLNGGLGATMGLAGPKSLLRVKGEWSFLDIFARAHKHLVEQAPAPSPPLLLMNSRATREASLAALARHGDFSGVLPADFVQHRVPRIDAQTLAPVVCADEPAREWAPPGHGDFYAALAGSGALAALRAAGVRYAFVSNADNLGATLDPALLGWFARSGAPFAMEVKARTPADRKGGHLACVGGRLLLRELAQCPPEERAQFQDVARHKFFNTNNLWLDLEALAAALERAGGVFDLPMMCARRPLAPGRSEEVLQLETAVGAGLSLFEDARAIVVSEARFLPVKTTGDLLLLRSDAFALGEDFVMRALASPSPTVTLGENFARLADFEKHFAHGVPSLLHCKSLRVEGDVYFGANVKITGEVTLKARAGETLKIENGTTLSG